MRRFSALLEEYEDMDKTQRMMVYMMWEEVAKEEPDVRYTIKLRNLCYGVCSWQLFWKNN